MNFQCRKCKEYFRAENPFHDVVPDWDESPTTYLCNQCGEEEKQIEPFLVKRTVSNMSV